MYIDPETFYDRVKGTLETVRSYFSRDKTAEYRTRALICFLPKWEGFFVNEAAEKMDATKALVKLNNVVKCVSEVLTEESGNPRKSKPSKFDAEKVIFQLLFFLSSYEYAIVIRREVRIL